jgi:hypothetical protein
MSLFSVGPAHTGLLISLFRKQNNFTITKREFTRDDMAFKIALIDELQMFLFFILLLISCDHLS